MLGNNPLYNNISLLRMNMQTEKNISNFQITKSNSNQDGVEGEQRSRDERMAEYWQLVEQVNDHRVLIILFYLLSICLKFSVIKNLNIKIHCKAVSPKVSAMLVF